MRHRFRYLTILVLALVLFMFASCAMNPTTSRKKTTSTTTYPPSVSVDRNPFPGTLPKALRDVVVLPSTFTGTWVLDCTKSYPSSLPSSIQFHAACNSFKSPSRNGLVIMSSTDEESDSLQVSVASVISSLTSHGWHTTLPPGHGPAYKYLIQRSSWRGILEMWSYSDVNNQSTNIREFELQMVLWY